MTRPGNAVAVKEQNATLANLIRQYREDFGAVVPTHISPDAFVNLAVAYVKQNEKLRAAAFVNPASLVLALRECAALGHTPQKGVFALTPRRDKNAPGGQRVVGIEEVRGVIERMYRSGGVSSVHVDTIRERDPLGRWQPSRMVIPEHEYDEFAPIEERGPLKAVYAFARLVTGGTVVAFLNRHDVQKYRDLSNTGETFWGPPWPAEGKWTVRMWEKTALHRLERDVPTSASYREAVARAESAAHNGRFDTLNAPLRSPSNVPDDAPIDAEILDDAPAQPAGDAAGGDPWAGVEVRQPGSGSTK